MNKLYNLSEVVKNKTGEDACGGCINKSWNCVYKLKEFFFL